MTNLHAQCLELRIAGVDPQNVVALAQYLNSPELIRQTFRTSPSDVCEYLYEGSLELVFIEDEYEWRAIAPSQL